MAAWRSVELKHCDVMAGFPVLQLTTEDEQGRVTVLCLHPTGGMSATWTRRCVRDAGLRPMPTMHVEDVGVVEIRDRMRLPTTPHDQVRPVSSGNCGVPCTRVWHIAACLRLVPCPCLRVQVVHFLEGLGGPVATENYDLAVPYCGSRVVGPRLGRCTSYGGLEPVVDPRIQNVDVVGPLPIALDASKHHHVPIRQSSCCVPASCIGGHTGGVGREPEIGFAIVYHAIIVGDRGPVWLHCAFPTKKEEPIP
mmetsp:Transcript_10078/g.35854  ORF Transcript_10078/g.35854 Transcript_10078/m.35854 type:complete len:251 (-) Transcript_10078:724-1476(-)